MTAPITHFFTSFICRSPNRVELPIPVGHIILSPTGSGDPAQSFLTLFIPYVTPFTTYHARYKDQQYRSSERNQDRHKVDPRDWVSDNCSGGEPYNKIYQIHFLPTPFRVLTTPGFQRLYDETCSVCQSHDQRESGVWVFVRSVTVV